MSQDQAEHITRHAVHGDGATADMTADMTDVSEESIFISRDAGTDILSLSKEFPVVTVTGPRQSGKSTLVRHLFPEYRYANLEDSAVRALAQNDPQLFFRRFPARSIIDEAQLVPSLLRDLQATVDQTAALGQYIITGSQNFALLRSVSESLAGRTGIIELLPLSWHELADAGHKPKSVDQWMLNGGYPRLFSTPARPPRFFDAYIRTYVDRDVRTQIGEQRLEDFDRFVRLCAARVGEVLNVSGLARDAQIDVRTARDWLSLLEASYVLFELQPYYKNFGKRLIRSPKLYFYDTGLLCSLLGIETEDDLLFNRQRGSIFENAVIVEVIKGFLAQGRTPHLSFWRDSNGNEIDLLIEKGVGVEYAVEIKSSSTLNYRFFTQLTKLSDMLGADTDHRVVAYAGSESFKATPGFLLGPDDYPLLWGEKTV
jgi:predicted AAA+ superfamily ATPase